MAGGAAPAVAVAEAEPPPASARAVERTAADPLASPTFDAAAGAPSSWEALQALQDLRDTPWEFGLLPALRRIEAAYAQGPRLGEGARPGEEPVRICQEPSVTFAPAEIASFTLSDGQTPPRLSTFVAGLLGPNGPLPLHLTEYARERLRNHADPTFARFLDIFHHRILSLFYRAWANGRPTVQHDRPERDRFALYLGALSGMASPAFRGRLPVRDEVVFGRAGVLAGGNRSAEGLRAVLADVFAVPAEIEPFIGSWEELREAERWRLGKADGGFALGRATVAGRRAWLRTAKFRVTLGPLDREQFDRFLPGRPSLQRLGEMVRLYAGDELDFDVRLVLAKSVERPWTLGQSRVGWTSWLGKAPKAATREDLIVDRRTVLGGVPSKPGAAKAGTSQGETLAAF